MVETDKEFLDQAAGLRGEAGELLDQYGLLSGIASYGLTEVIGSYALDLMTWRDIDIQLPDERDVNRFEATMMSYANMFIRTDQDFPSGLYRGIRLLHRGQTWKVDLWGTVRENTPRKRAPSRSSGRLWQARTGWRSCESRTPYAGGGSTVKEPTTAMSTMRWPTTASPR